MPVKRLSNRPTVRRRSRSSSLQKAKISMRRSFWSTKVGERPVSWATPDTADARSAAES